MSAKSAAVEAAHNGSGEFIGRANTLAILTGGPRPPVRKLDPEEERRMLERDRTFTKQRVMAFGASPDAAAERRLSEDLVYRAA
jgi:hypothetical protein